MIAKVWRGARLDLASHDFDTAVAWYGELFDWSHQVMPTPGDAPAYVFFMKAEAEVCGVAQMSDELKARGIPPMWNSYISTEDCDATLAKVTELGGTVTFPTMEVPGNGRLAFLLDPEEASVALWQSTNKNSPGLLVNELGGWCWTELMNRETDQATAFYSALVGWEYSDVPMGHVEYKLIKSGGKDAGGMMKMCGPHFEGIPAYWLVYFSVANCEESCAKVQATGGKVLVPTTEISVGLFSVISDPRGAVFG